MLTFHKDDPRRRMVGGDHYLPGAGPLEFASSRRWDAYAFSMFKRAARATLKGQERLDLEKLRHEFELFLAWRNDPMDPMTLGRFIGANSPRLDTDSLRLITTIYQTVEEGLPETILFHEIDQRLSKL